MKVVRCAIYTRKSSEEGLEQGFNSLDAQREACAAYVLSQASEGWQLMPDLYDDGGLSGGTLDRPALTRLLADVSAGKIDIIVVYKVDRLTRSLLDFAKLVEAFDKAGTSFVSITQSFNTTTSMGRLTLNMLLSFAQFEREVTAERIRDKISASKAKGMWMGGTPPLGYEANGRSLAIVENHAVIIRDIYERYLQLGNVTLVAEHLAIAGIHPPIRQSLRGRTFGGRPFSFGNLYSILKNPIYAGDIPHRGKVYAGLHPAIIDREMWLRVQERLGANTRGQRRLRQPNASLLAGLIVDATGKPMTASHACKGQVRYRYYISASPSGGNGAAPSLRLPARDVEAAVAEQIACLFEDPLALMARLKITASAQNLNLVTERSALIVAKLRSRNLAPLPTLVTRVHVEADRLSIKLNVEAALEMLRVSSDSMPIEPITIEVAFRLTRTGRAIRLIQAEGTRAKPGDIDPALLGLVIKARQWWTILRQGELDIARLADREGVSRSYVSRVLRIAFLSPEVVEAILDGRQHGELDAARLRETNAVPACWADQAVRFLPKAQHPGTDASALS